MKTFKNKLPDDLRSIWDATSNLKTNAAVDTADAWMRLEQKLDKNEFFLQKFGRDHFFLLFNPGLPMRLLF